MRVSSAVLGRLPVGGSGWLRRSLVVLLLVVATLSVIGMHQLSLGHAFATPSSAHHHSTSTDAGTGPAHHRGAAAENGPTGQQTVVSPIMTSMPTTNGAGCPSCGGHSMTASICLLALTLLVSLWWLRPPQARALFLERPWSPVAVTMARARRVPALSLTELSILRT